MRHLIFLLLFTLLFTTQARAELPPVEGNILLTVSGKIRHTNQLGYAAFDLQLLESLDQHEIKTSNPWVAGHNVYTGPLGRALVELVGADLNSTMRFTSLNGFISDIPVTDFIEHDVILAIKKNGKYQRIRDRGPLFIIYPFDEQPQLNTEMHYNRSVWQVKTIEFR